MGAFARRVLLQNPFEMYQFRAEDLQALPEFLNLMIDFFFEVGRFLNLITDVDVHESLEMREKNPRSFSP
jgi:hypothetical protein